MNKVIVIGGDHHNTLGVIRSLGERGIYSNVILISLSKMTYVDSSKYISNLWRIRSEKEIIDVLLSQFRDEEEKPVVICCSDLSSGLIDENLGKLAPLFYLPGGGEEGRIATLMNKQKMAELAGEVGLKTPKTFYFSDLSQVQNRIQLPCIIKPIESRKGKKTEITVCNTLEELQSYSFSHELSDYQIQDYIDKEFEFQLIGCSTNREVIIPGVSIILRPCNGSNTSFLHYSPLVDDFCEIDKCRAFVKQTGYRGLFSMEFLRDKQGNDYFMEINFRNDGNAICVTAAGMSLPYIWYLDCIGEDYGGELSKELRPVYVLPDMAELKLLITRQISLKEYINDLRKTDRFMEYDKYDRKPFWKLLKYQICSKAHICSD